MLLISAPHFSASRRIIAAELFRRRGRDLDRDVGHALLHLGQEQRAADLAVEPRDDLLRHGRRTERAVPHRHLVARHGLGDGRHIGQQRRALRLGDAEQLEPAGLDVLEALRAGGEEQLHLSADRVGDRRRAAAIRHVQHLDAGHALEQRGAQMIGRAGPGRRIGDLAGIGLGVGDELRDRVRRHRRVHHHGVGHVGEQRDRREILHAVERHGGEQSVVHGVHAHGVEQDGVAVRRRARDRAGADIAGRAGAVLDHHRLAHRLVQMRGDDARQNVGRAARRPRHQQRDRAGGIGLRGGGAQRRCRRDGGEDGKADGGSGVSWRRTVARHRCAPRRTDPLPTRRSRRCGATIPKAGSSSWTAFSDAHRATDIARRIARAARFQRRAAPPMASGRNAAETRD